MRKIICLMIALLMVGSVAFAGHHHPALVDNDSFRDEYSEYQKTLPQYKLGLGVDTILYEFEGMPSELGFENVELQQKWNGTDSRYEGYVVVKTNAWKLIKGFFGIK